MILFEQEVLNTIKDKGNYQKNRILTFEELSKEFLENIKRNLSISYYIKAKDTVSRFNNFLKEIHLNFERKRQILSG